MLVVLKCWIINVQIKWIILNSTHFNHSYTSPEDAFNIPANKNCYKLKCVSCKKLIYSNYQIRTHDKVSRVCGGRVTRAARGAELQRQVEGARYKRRGRSEGTYHTTLTDNMNKVISYNLMFLVVTTTCITDSNFP